MGISKELASGLDNGISRRGFLKGAAAAGSLAALYGCSKGESGEVIYGNTGSGSGGGTVEVADKAEVKYYYGVTVHDCGGRCLARAVVSEGKIKRFLTDDTQYAYDGTWKDPESPNFPQTRNCSRCRAYKYRLYHPGRLRYPLKQTKKRGDLSGFVRITWEQALKEIAHKHKTVLEKYDVDGIYAIIGSGNFSGALQGGPLGPLGATSYGGGSLFPYLGGVTTAIYGSYSVHQHDFFDVGYTGADEDLRVNAIRKYTKNIVSWGDNLLSTAHSKSYGLLRAVEEMKKRKYEDSAEPDPDFYKYYYIGPVLSDGGVVMADTWAPMKPFTDCAVMAAMVYHMLDNTFDLQTGALKENAWLDVNYLDTMVYGFFDSPAYSLDDADGSITAAGAAGKRQVPAVTNGQSYASWILGNNNNAPSYSTSDGNYTERQFAAIGGGKRWAPCSYPVSSSNTSYRRKKDYQTAKTPEWAEKISGIKADVIKTLAKVYALGGPVSSIWSGGMQKQLEGIANLFGLQALHIITKNVGRDGASISNRYVYHDIRTDHSNNNDFLANVEVPGRTIGYAQGKQKPIASCVAWKEGIKLAIKLGGLKCSESYNPDKYIPNTVNYNIDKDGTLKSDVYQDDASAKTFIQWVRNDTDNNVVEYTGDDGKQYYDYVGRAENSPVFVGPRLIYNISSNAIMNQGMNTNESREMLEALDLNDIDDADTLCIVSHDNFMTATPRWSDYVLPAATAWEEQDILTPEDTSPIYVPQLVTPPGESKAIWDFANALIQVYDPSKAADFAGGEAGRSVESIVREAFNTAKATPGNAYSNMSWEEYVEKQYLPAKPDDSTLPISPRKAAMDNYNAFSETDEFKTEGFIKPDAADHFIATNEAADGANQGMFGFNIALSGRHIDMFNNIDEAPKSPRRFQVYSPVLVWQYKNRLNKWHGYLPAEKRGQQHVDSDGDDYVLPIPAYYPFEDGFMEVYGNKYSPELTFNLTTSHDRYRVHTSQSENPLLRELNHRVPNHNNGASKWTMGNDNGYFAQPPASGNFTEIKKEADGNDIYPEPSAAIGENIIKNNEDIKYNDKLTYKQKDLASYLEIWMNKEAAESKGINDGDLVLVENPIGALLAAAKLTNRCHKDHADLHEGGWYEPRKWSDTIPEMKSSFGHDYIDVGGCANTLISSHLSRTDHGNPSQCALVKISKVQGY